MLLWQVVASENLSKGMRKMLTHGPDCMGVRAKVIWHDRLSVRGCGYPPLL